MNPEDIPGMTERIEQKLLNSISQSVKLEADEVMLEFGTYFGRSTRSIVNGVLQNKNIDLTSRLEPVSMLEAAPPPRPMSMAGPPSWMT